MDVERCRLFVVLHNLDGNDDVESDADAYADADADVDQFLTECARMERLLLENVYDSDEAWDV